jgi:hypothetical protein
MRTAGSKKPRNQKRDRRRQGKEGQQSTPEETSHRPHVDLGAANYTDAARYADTDPYGLEIAESRASSVRYWTSVAEFRPSVRASAPWPSEVDGGARIDARDR